MPSIERDIIETMFMIADKEGNDVPFLLNEAQASLDDSLTGRDLIPKARQEGVSSYILARLTVRCLHRRNTRAVVISHDRESTERLFMRVKYFLDNIRGPKAILELASKRELTFPKTNSMFYIGTAGARKFGRGDTITDLHCSEVAFWESPKDLFSGLSDAVPRTGSITIESTGNGKEWYYGRVMAAIDGKSRYKVHFLDWQSFPEYNLKLTDEEAEEIRSTLDPDLEETDLFNSGRLTLGQIKFRREKLEEKDWDLDLFKQEYPMTIDECFRSTGRSIFHKVNYYPTKKWVRVSPQLWTMEDHPQPHFHYAIGCDTSAGVGGDNAVIEVICLEEQEQVAEWVSDRTAPDILGDRVASLGRQYNNAYITIERNNHGILTIDIVRKQYPSHLIYKDKTRPKELLMSYGFNTSARSKPLAIGLLRKMLAEDLIIHSPFLKSELDTFVEKEGGQLEAEDTYNDDRVMAMAIAVMGFAKAAYMTYKYEPQVIERSDPFLLDTIIDELQGRGKNFPISPQHQIQ